MNLINVSQDEWREYCKGCLVSSIYLDPRWLELIELVYPGLKIHRLVCLEDSNRLKWLLPLVEIKPLGKWKPMMISLPFGNYGGFILPVDTKDGLADGDLEPIVRFFDKSKAFALEIREIHKPKHDFQIQDGFTTFELLFPEDLEVLWKKVISGNARTSVRKADKLNIKVVFNDPRALDVFQKIYEKDSSFHGTPIHALKWYEALTTLFHQESLIVLAEYEDRFIGASLILLYQGKSMLHASVTDPEYRKIPISDKLIWSAFEHLVQKRLASSFDFGRTRPVPGKLFFKRKWGGIERPIYYSYLIKPGAKIPQILPENPKMGPAIHVWSKMPMALTRLIGPFFRTRIPT